MEHHPRQEDRQPSAPRPYVEKPSTWYDRNIRYADRLGLWLVFGTIAAGLYIFWHETLRHAFDGR